MKLILILCVLTASMAHAQESFVTFSAHIAVPQEALNYYSKEGPGITVRYNHAITSRWMAVAMAGIEEFHPRKYATTSPNEILRRDARAFPLQTGIRLNLFKNQYNGQMYVSALSGLQIIRVSDSDPVVLYDSKPTHFNFASDVGYRLRQIDFNVYFNWGGFTGRYKDFRYFTLGIGYNFQRPFMCYQP